MSYLDLTRRLAGDPEQLELTYQQAAVAGQAQAFSEAVESAYRDDPDNLLYAAWHYRLAHTAATAARRVIAWNWAIPLAVLNGLLLWLLSDENRFTLEVANPVTGASYNVLPLVALLAAPISAAVIVLFLTLAGDRRWRRFAAVALGLAASAVYVLLIFPVMWPRVFQEQYLGLMVLHLGLLAWAGIGVVAMGRGFESEQRFAFLFKSLEALVVAGLFAIVGGIFMGITFGLFGALGIDLPDAVARLFIAGGAGLIIVVAVALVYDPAVRPAEQSFDEGLSKLIALLMRLLLPLTVGVLLVYLAFIPFNFREPFENRDVLIVFNVMLFAVLALMIGATPVRSQDVSPRGQMWLRSGIIALALLAILVSVYALAAIIYRTSIDRLTPNRLTFIGWNIINIVILVLLLIKQLQAGRERWLPAMHRTFAVATVFYIVWTIFGIIALPVLFRGDPAQVAGLPVRVQQIAYEEPYPVLLKCSTSPHIYLLEDGQKRWIKDIATFEARGYRWNDVRYVNCDDLAAVPDGVPIPPDAGPPPQP
ncbi:MAG: hypothetical protein H6649_08505 [Caldilineae bacterium]|nr:hypothetical protein [Caldilineae bacterium]